MAYFKTLMELARSDYHPELTVVRTGTAEHVKKSGIRPWQWYAVDDFFKLFFPEEMESGIISVEYDDDALCLQVLFSDNNVYHVVFSDEFQDTVKIQFPENLKYPDRFQGFYLFDTVSGQIGMDEDDEETMLIKFIGRITGEAMRQKGLILTPGNSITVDKFQAIPSFI